MKVLHIITGLDAGGAEAVLAHLVLADTRNEHLVVSMQDKGAYGQPLIDAGISVIELAMPSGSLSISGLRRLYSTIKNEKPDIVQTWMYHSDLIGALVARLAGHKSICWGIHNSNISAKVLSLSSRLVVKACALTASWLPKRIISCSSYAAQIHKDAGYAAHKFEVVFNGYDLSRFQPIPDAGVELRSSLSLEPGCLLLGTVARWHPVKDHKSLFAALSSINLTDEWRLVLVGPGMTQENSELQECLEKFQIADKCILMGLRDDVPQILSALDLHILSSVGEAFPNAVAEAMACGTPCVVTDVGDAALIVDNTGEVVPASDVQALREAIRIMLSAVKKRVSKEDQNNQRNFLHTKISSRFSSSAMVEGYNAVWQNAAESKVLSD